MQWTIFGLEVRRSSGDPCAEGKRERDGERETGARVNYSIPAAVVMHPPNVTLFRPMLQRFARHARELALLIVRSRTKPWINIAILALFHAPDEFLQLAELAKFGV